MSDHPYTPPGIARVHLRRSATALAAISIFGGAAAQDAPAPAAPASAAVPAAAASSSPAEPVVRIEQVIVTARKRIESVQDVPASIKVFSAGALQDAGVSQINDFVNLTPNVSIVKSQSAGISFITIRGLTQVRNADAPIAMVVDGVQVPNSKSFTQDLFDLQSVQILRGPQGAIYGRNAPGGAVLITTKAPVNATQGYVEGGFGTGDERFAKGVVSGALVDDKLFYRVGGSLTGRDGYFENINLDKKQDPYHDSTLHGLLRWYPAEGLSIDARLNGAYTTGGANNFTAQNILYDPNNRCHLDPANPFGGPAVDANLVTNYFCSAYVGRNDRSIVDGSLKADYSFDAGTLTAIYGYNRVREYEGGTQYPYTATPNLFGSLNGTQTQYTDDTGNSVEIRMSSPDDQRVRWQGGVYFLKASGYISTSTGSDTGTGIARLTRTPQFDATDNPTLSWLADTRHDTARAVFGNAAVDVVKDLEASAGFRYDRTARHQDVDPDQTGGVPPGCTASTREDCVNEANFSAFQPTAALRWKVDSSWQLYTTFGKGFRAGQFNQTGAAAAAAAAGVVGVNDLVRSELTTSFEVGFKTEVNGALRVEGSLFKTHVDGSQYFLFVPSISAQVLANIDRVSLSGGELEMQAAVAPGAEINAGLGVTDSRIDRYALNPDDVGKWAPYVPRVSLNLGAQDRFGIGIGHGLALLTRVDFISKGKQYWDPENSTPRSTVNLVNLRLGIEDVNRKWSITGSVVNATNRRYNEEYVAGGFATIANPRVFRLDGRYNF
jgi:iron complex outermembrane receptor protein